MILYQSCRERQWESEKWGISSAGRALHWQCRGQRFDPAMLHQSKIIRMYCQLVICSDLFLLMITKGRKIGLTTYFSAFCNCIGYFLNFIFSPVFMEEAYHTTPFLRIILAYKADSLVVTTAYAFLARS